MCLNIEATNAVNGVLFIGCNEEGEKTDPEKIPGWFSEEFIKTHKVYAIKEEKPLLLKIYTRDREVANKVIRRKGGRKSMLMGQEVYGEVIVACGRCGYRSSEGSNVRRHLKKSVCAKDKGYSKRELDGLNRLERQKFIRRVAAAKFRAKKKQQVNEETTIGEPQDLNTCRLKGMRKPKTSKALLLGPYVEKETIRRVSFDVFTVGEQNVKHAWKPLSCHKASTGEICQIVFKGARMRRRCLDFPLPIILIYRKLDCKVHHCNFTLFHPHARNAFREDRDAKTSVDVTMYEDTVMTREFYHHFVALLSVMKGKPCQCARYLTSAWEAILLERLKSSSVPEEFRKLITLSKQTVKTIWGRIEEESGKKDTTLLPRPRKKKCPSFAPESHTSPPQISTPNHLHGASYPHSTTHPMYPPTMPDVQMQQQPPQPFQNHHVIHSHIHHSQQEFSEQTCMKRFSHPISKNPLAGSGHTLPLPHSHNMLQAPTHPHWITPVGGQPHSTQYPPSIPYSVPGPHEDYFSVQASFVTQFTPASIGATP